MNKTKKNIVLVSIYQVIYVITPIITTPYVTRVIGAEGIGVYSFYNTVALYATLFIRLGVMTYGSRAVAKAERTKEELSKIFSEIYSLQLVCGCSVISVYLVWSIHLSSNLFLCFSFIPYILSAGIDITWFLYGVEDFKTTTIRDIIVRLFIVLMIFALVNKKEDLWKYALIQGFGFLIGQMIAWLRLKHYVSFVKPIHSEVLKHLRPNLVLFLPTIAVSLYKLMDKIMLGVMSRSSELGYYESSERIVNLPLAFVTAIGTVMLPRMSNYFSKNSRDMSETTIIDKSAVLVTFLTTSICFGIMTVSHQFVPMFYGNGYDKCIEIYKWLLPSCIFVGISNVIKTQCLLPRNADKYYVIATFAGAIINLIANIFLIPLYSSVGAAIATMISEVSVFIIIYYAFRKQFPAHGLILLVCPYIVAGILMYNVFNGYRVNVHNMFLSIGLKVLICGFFYFIVCFLLIIINRFVRYCIYTKYHR